MTITQPSHECIELDGGVLGRLSFEWMGDRYQHRWHFGEDSQRIIESVESDHSQHWPVSPPLQQVYRQTFDDGRDVMFGIGMAGRGHWSVSFTLVPDLKSWIVELACRSSSEPQRLCSSYLLKGNWQPESKGSDGTLSACVLSDVGLRIEPLSILSRLELSYPDMMVKPDQIPSGLTTIQWGYRLRLV